MQAAASTRTTHRAVSIAEKTGHGSASAEGSRRLRLRLLVAARGAAAVRAELTVRIPTRKTPGRGKAIAELPVECQILERARYVPILGVLIARLAVALRHVLVQLHHPVLRSPRGIVDARLHVQRGHAVPGEVDAVRRVVEALLGMRLGTNLPPLQQRRRAHRLLELGVAA